MSDDARAGRWKRFIPDVEYWAVGGIAALLLLSPAGALFRGLIRAIGSAAAALVSLSVVDRPTIGLFAVIVVRLAVALVPAILAAPRVPWPARAWFVAFGLAFVVLGPVSLAAVHTLPMWIALVALSALATYLVRFRRVHFACVLPVLLFLEPARHHTFGRSTWTREKLAPRCAANDGKRPVNATPEHFVAAYYGVTKADDDHLLLTGQHPDDGRFMGWDKSEREQIGGSWWLSRKGDEIRFERPSKVTGNFWRGCLLDGTIWFSKYGHLLGAKRLGDGDKEFESVRDVDVPHENDMDSPNAACDPARGALYWGELLNGDLWEVKLATGERKKVHVGGVAVQLFQRRDGRVVMIDTSDLSVFDPAEGKVVDRIAAGMGLQGIDICANDDSVVVADFAGRVREFSPDAAGHYRFKWGISLTAPRQVYYSPDCAFMAATSGDDETVFIVDRAERRVIKRFRVGPALRGMTFLGPREVGVVDACTLTSLRF